MSKSGASAATGKHHVSAVAAALTVTFGGLTFTACHRIQIPVSVIRMNDAAASNQLLSGFYITEENAWRWTAPQFSVALKPPAGSGVNGATLDLSVFIATTQMDNLGPITLRAAIREYRLDPETFTRPGRYEYRREIPADILDTNVITADFCLDKSTAPTPVEGRRLGIVVNQISLRPN